MVVAENSLSQLMLLLLRKMKQSSFDNTRFRKYALYALGEMALVIVGILIALQIDNWNSERKEEESLRNYLDTIARNIRDDLNKVKAIQARRLATAELALWEQSFIQEREFFTVDEISFANFALVEAQQIRFLNANTTGYDALKNSGILEQLQGRDVEHLLFDYYETVSRIAQAEKDHNEYVRQLRLQVNASWPSHLAQWEFDDPQVLVDDRFEALQPAFRQVIRDASVNALYMLAQAVDELLLEYKRLERLGTALVRMNENRTMSFDAATSAMLNEIYDPNSGAAYPTLIADGQISLHSYTLGTAASLDPRIVGRSDDPDISFQDHPFTIETITRSDDSLHFDYDGRADWAAVFIYVRGTSATRPSLDFSGLDRIQIEMKGDVGGEQVLVHLKDSLDLDDGTQTNIPIQLTDKWQTYEIDLDRFETADLSRLYVVLGFLFFEEPQSFSLRNARYVRAEP
jgi:hypothetical protein